MSVFRDSEIDIYRDLVVLFYYLNNLSRNDLKLILFGKMF